jgi:autophagy-related protein 9
VRYTKYDFTLIALPQAANPDWNPTDPAGSIYLSRLADFTPIHGPSMHRRHARFGNRLGADLRYNGGGTRAFAHAPIPIPQIHSPGSGATPPMSQEQRNAERAKMYETAFQKSHATKSAAGGVGGPGAAKVPKPAAIVKEPSTLADEDIKSDLGDSYVDGIGPRGPRGLDDDGMADQVEVEELANGGVMGLLTQIYDQRRPVL